MAWLVKRESKKYGWTYAVRFRVNGRVVEIATGSKSRTIANHLRHRYESEELKKKHGIDVKRQPLKLSELFERRRKWLETNNKSINTFRRERSSYHAFKKFLNSDTTHTPDLETLEAFKAYRKDRGIVGNTINGDIGFIQSLYRWGKKMGYCDYNDIPIVTRIRSPKKQPVYLETEEIEKFFWAIDVIPPPISKNRRRDEEESKEFWKMVFELYFSTGGRKEEIANLKWQDIDFEAREVIFRGEMTKSKEERRIPIPDSLITRLEKIRERPENFIIPFGGTWIYRVYKTYALASGIKDREKLKLHTTRHTCASHLAKGGTSPFIIMQILGHANMDTTLIYTRLAPSDCREALNSLPWVSN